MICTGHMVGTWIWCFVLILFTEYFGDKDAVKNVDIVAGKMTPVQIADAEKLSRECIA